MYICQVAYLLLLGGGLCYLCLESPLWMACSFILRYLLDCDASGGPAGMSPPRSDQDNHSEEAAGRAGEPMQAKGPPEESERWLRSSIDNAEGDWGKENTRFHSRLLDAIGQTIIATDLQDRVVYWNDAAAQLYGWSEEEATGRRLKELVVCEKLWTQAEDIGSQLRSGRAWSGEFVVRRKDGE